MKDNWFLPGGPVVSDDGTKLHLEPPSTWRKDVLEITRVPPSMNDNKIRSNWRGFHGYKKSWQEEIGQLLMKSGMPRQNKRAWAGAFIRFGRHFSKDPEPSNYRGLVDKACGDAMILDPLMPIDKRYIPDDDEQHYFFGGVEFDLAQGPPLTTIWIYTEPNA